MKYRLNLEEIELTVNELNINQTVIDLIAVGVLIPLQEPEFPQKNDMYFHLNSWGIVSADSFQDHPKHEFRKKFGKLFKTREEAEKYKADLLAKG